MIRIQAFLFWVCTWPLILYRLPLTIVLALLCWAIWLWLWEVWWPWAKLVLKIFGKLFERIGDALEWLPRKSKATVVYLEHIMNLCEGDANRCPHHPKEKR